MKRLIKPGILFVFTLLFIQPSNAQSLLDRMKDKAKKKVEQRLEDKMDEKMDQALDSLEQSIDPGAGDTQNNNANSYTLPKMLKGMGISGDPVPYNDSYEFSHMIQMHVEVYDGSGKQTSDGEFITHFDPNSEGLAYEVLSGDIGSDEQGFFIIDVENGAMIILNKKDSEKTGIVYGINSFFDALGETTDEEWENQETPAAFLNHPNVKKTGKSKKIAGYKCEQYLYSDENTDSEFWISDDVKIDSRDYFSSIFRISAYSSGMGWGYVMESTSTDKSSGDKSKMTVTKVDDKAKTKFDLSDYQITNFGSFTLPEATDDE